MIVSVILSSLVSLPPPQPFHQPQLSVSLSLSLREERTENCMCHIGGVLKKKDMRYFTRIGHVYIVKWLEYETNGTQHCYGCKVL